MARYPHLRRLADDWPVIFAVGVAIWFAAAGLGATGVSFSHDNSATGTAAKVVDDTTTTDDIATTKNPENTPVVVGPLKFKVVSFRVQPDKKSPGTLNG